MVIASLQALIDHDKMTPRNIVKSSKRELSEIIGKFADHPEDNGSLKALQSIARELERNGGNVPSSKKDLLEIKVESTVASQLMREVFGVRQMTL